MRVDFTKHDQFRGLAMLEQPADILAGFQPAFRCDLTLPTCRQPFLLVFQQSATETGSIFASCDGSRYLDRRMSNVSKDVRDSHLVPAAFGFWQVLSG